MTKTKKIDAFKAAEFTVPLRKDHQSIAMKYRPYCHCELPEAPKESATSADRRQQKA